MPLKVQYNVFVAHDYAIIPVQQSENFSQITPLLKTYKKL